MKQAAILGAGVCGLTTGNILKDRYPDAEVTIYAKDTSNIVSYVACAQFYPIWLGRNLPPGYDQRLKKWFLKSKHEFTKRTGPAYGIRHHRNHELFKSDEIPPAYFHDVLSNLEVMADPTLPLDYSHRFSFDTMIIDTTTYMPRIAQDFLRKGGTIVSKHFDGLESVLAMEEPVIFNCLGHGASKVFGDKDVRPAKGVVLLMKPLSTVPQVVSAGEFILAPRERDLYVGASYSESWDTPEATPAERDHLFNSLKAIMETPDSIFSLPKGSLERSNIVETLVGFRPLRQTGPRVAKETIRGRDIIHNYGHGGNGVILSWGTAHEAVELMS